MSGVIDLSPRATPSDSRSSLRRIHAYPLHRRQIDYQAAVARSEPSDVMASPSHSESPMAISRKVYRADNVGNIGASRNEPWVPIDHRVVGFLSLFIALIFWAVEIPSKGVVEPLARVFLEI
jgi:hypothetical protein